jgi:hypothetical protein
LTRATRAAPLALLLLAACSGGDGAAGAQGAFLAAAHELGPELSGDADFPVDDPALSWTASELVVPLAGYDFPASAIPLFVWEEVAMAQSVADEGSCPYVLTDSEDGATTTTWESDCRSQDGYEWLGDMSRTTWSEADADGVQWTRWTMALEVEAGIDEPSFDRLGLQGTLWFGLGDGEALLRVAQANVAVVLEGYWSRQGGDEAREAAWGDLRLRGTWEEHETGAQDTHRFAATARLGALGGLAVEGPALQESAQCAAEPDGEVALEGAARASLRFDGATSCDRCASLEVEGEAAQQTCDA